ncbi:MAG TPA: PIN domain-containing protein [Candidatus Competibacteraceae bacterium]|nr:PIN domain-containing protein [Candidatus Competibacteraceae bacterium]
MKLFLDTNAIVYLVEAVDPWYGRVRQILQEHFQRHGRVGIAVSALSWLECRIKPLRDGDQTLLARYETFFSRPGLCVCPVDMQVLDRAARLRAAHRLRTPDAIQVASAVTLEEEIGFVTADVELGRVTELRLVAL